MNTRQLGNTDLQFTTIGLGTWAIGGENWSHGWGPQEDADSIATIHRALDLGINWIDTAAAYGLGHAEKVVRQALAARGAQVYIATKCGILWQDDGSWDVTFRLTKESIHREVEDSLRRLGLETIDLYQIHYPIPDEELEEGWHTISQLIKEGKVRYAGISNNSLEQLQRIKKIHPVASIQPQYSMLERGPEQALLAYCAENGIGVLAYSPLRSGIITEQFDHSRLQALDEREWRRSDPDFQEPRATINIDFVQKLRTIALELGVSVSSLAVAWVLAHPEVTSAIVGARRPSHINKTASAVDLELSAETMCSIDELLAERENRLAELKTAVAA